MLRQRLIPLVGVVAMLIVALIFVGVSLTTLDMGSALRMGPGAFPAIVGGVFAVLALVNLVHSLRSPVDGSGFDPVSALAVAGGIAAFAFFTPVLGVLPAVVLSVLTTASAVPQFRWRGRLMLSLCVAVGVWAVFVKGLGIPFTLFRGL